MAKDIGALETKLIADLGELKRALWEGRDELSNFKEMSQSFAGQIKKALSFVGISVGLYELVSAIKHFVSEAVMTGARTEVLQVAMYQVGENANISREALDYYTEEIKRAGITTQESMSAITTAINAGIDITKLKDLATRARDIAVLTGRNTSETLGAIMRGLVTRQMEIIRNLQVPVRNYEDVLKDLAKTLGKKREEIDRVTVTMALLDEVMRASAKSAGAAAKADEVVGKQLGSMARHAEEARNALWKLFQPVMFTAVRELTKAWIDLRKWAEANQAALAAWGAEMATWLTAIGRAVRATIEWISKNWELVKALAALFIMRSIASLVITLTIGIANLVGKIGLAIAGIRTLAAVATIATTAFGGWLAKILGVVVALGVLGAYRTFTHPEEAHGSSDPFAPAPLPGVKKKLGIPTPETPKEPYTPMEVLDFQKFSKEKAEAEAKAAAEAVRKEAQKQIDEMMKGMGEAGGKGGSAAAKSYFQQWQAELEEIQRTEKKYFGLSIEEEKKFWRSKLAQCKEGTGDYRRVQHRLYELEKKEAKAALEDQIANLRLQMESEKITAAQKLRLQDEIVKKIGKIYGKESAEYKAAQMERVRIAREVEKEITRIKEIEIEKRRELASIDLEMEDEHIRFRREMGLISEVEEISQLMRLERRKYALKRKALEDDKRLLHEHSEEVAKINRQIEILEKRHALHLQRLNHQKILALKKQWDTLWGSVSRAFTMSLQGIIMGTTTLKEALANIFQSILSSFIEMITQMVLQWVTAWIFGKLIGMKSAASSIVTDAHRGAAAAYASTCAIPIIGPIMAPAAAAAAFAGIMSYLPGALASAAGGWDVPRDALALVHKEEMILPADLANRIRAMTAAPARVRRSTQVNLTINAVDAQSVKRLFNRHGPSLADSLAVQARNFKRIKVR